jgi:hypothetical protein
MRTTNAGFVTLVTLAWSVAGAGAVLADGPNQAVLSGKNFWRVFGNGGTNPGLHFLGTTDHQDLVIKTNGTEAMRISAGGHLGVGAANPGVFGIPGPLFSLDVRNPNPFSPDTVVSISSDVGQATLRLHSLNQEAILGFGNGGEFSSSSLLLDKDTEALHFCVASTDNCQLATDVRLTIEPSGDVGVGTKTPQSALQVVGYAQLDLTSGTPPAADCDEASERGRMKVDSAGAALYVCVDAGWVAK